MAEAAPLVILPAPLGETAPLEVLPLSIRHWIEKIDHYIVENEKVARRTIKKIAPQKKQEELQFYILDKYSQEIEIQPYLEPCLSGIPMGVLSDAGCPAEIVYLDLSEASRAVAEARIAGDLAKDRGVVRPWSRIFPCRSVRRNRSIQQPCGPALFPDPGSVRAAGALSVLYG